MQKLGFVLLFATDTIQLAGVVEEAVYLDSAGVEGAELEFGVAMLKVYSGVAACVA